MLLRNLPWVFHSSISKETYLWVTGTLVSFLAQQRFYLRFCYLVIELITQLQLTRQHRFLTQTAPEARFPVNRHKAGLHLYCSDFSSKLLENIPLGSQLSGFFWPKVLPHSSPNDGQVCPNNSVMLVQIPILGFLFQQ